ncbi:hypothetical protein BLS_009553 [Venturia inaequalis]|uniref:Uncharacterized protein n=1 Tax=Venturia inaequalis TaxID=5025 RepID=A0A8H3U4P4_VENIN|nr:hypothetical protein BLS_009553 [Venturia inaequalis]KAE9965088.1 hypothetical protein EG328_009979 [Venturia inaequalis]RDI78336.1 hypothetical protein Vi05172_g11789 [Venturia inaequalis]
MNWLSSKRRRRPKPAGAESVESQPAAITTPASHANPLSQRKLSKRRSSRPRTPTEARPTIPQTNLKILKDDDLKEKDLHTPPLAPLSPSSTAMRSHFGRGTTDSLRSEEQDITALPHSRALRTSPHLRPVTQTGDTTEIPYNWDMNNNAASPPRQSLPPAKPRHGKLQRNPSRNKRAADERPLTKRPSTKKRKDDHLREEEIRAMSMPIPIPRKSDPNDSGGLLRRESRRARSGLNRHLERPVSNISLPLEESIHSSMSGASGSRNYRLSVFDIVAPRPTIRYTVHHTPYPQGQPMYKHASRGDSRAKTIVAANSRDGFKEQARIDSLADELDASELREVMERDKRRTEKKRRAEQERLQQKLERKAERQRSRELREQLPDVGSLTSPIMKEIGLGIATAVPTVIHEEVPEVKEVPTFHMEDVDETGPELSPPSGPTRPEQHNYFTRDQIPRMPLLSSDIDADEFRAETPFSDFETPMETAMELEGPDLEGARAMAYATGRMSPVYPGNRRKASRVLGEDVGSGDFAKISKVLDDKVEPSDLASLPPILERKKSGMWSSIFRRDKRKTFAEADRQSVPSESSFSNTSRESTSRLPPPAHLYQPPSHTSGTFRSTNAMPVRTMSKFREDLPESPISPPDSRVSSPVDMPKGAKAIAARRGFSIPSTIHTETSSRRLSSPYQEHLGQGRTDSPVSAGRASNLMSASLASVDSEGSWLSGRPHRMSSRARKRNSIETASVSRAADEFTGSFEELGMSDDEYFRKINHHPGESHASGLPVDKASSSAIALHSTGTSDSEGELRRATSSRPKKEGETMMHTGASRQPTVVHRDGRVKSSEGLLNQFMECKPEDEYPTPQGSPTKEHFDDGDGTASDGQTPTEDTPFQRATSVTLGKSHVRGSSGSSARLLDIPRRPGSQASGSAIATPKLT